MDTCPGSPAEQGRPGNVITDMQDGVVVLQQHGEHLRQLHVACPVAVNLICSRRVLHNNVIDSAHTARCQVGQAAPFRNTLSATYFRVSDCIPVLCTACNHDMLTGPSGQNKHCRPDQEV